LLLLLLLAGRTRRLSVAEAAVVVDVALVVKAAAMLGLLLRWPLNA